MTPKEPQERAKELLKKYEPVPYTPKPRHLAVGDWTIPETLCGELYLPGYDIMGDLDVKDGRFLALHMPDNEPITCPGCIAVLQAMKEQRTPAAQ